MEPQSGDREHQEFLRRFLREEGIVRAFLAAAVGDPHAAEDLFQTTACVLWERWDRYDQSRPFRAWALGCARLEVLKHRQKIARSKVVLSEEAVRELSVTAEQLHSDLDGLHASLQECVGRLPRRSRRLLGLRYETGLKIRQIAEHLGKSVPAVEMIYVRIRRALRTCLERKTASA